jgi:hypothetical protein
MKAMLACSAVALFAVSGANATIYKQIYKGIVTDPDPAFTTDYDNLIGGGNLAGASYTATFLWDDGLGTTITDANSRYTYGERDPFDPASPPTPNLLSSLTINGKTFSFSDAEYADVYSQDDSSFSEVYSNSVRSGSQLAFVLYSPGHAAFATPSWNYAGNPPYNYQNRGVLLSSGDELRMIVTYYSIAPISAAAVPELASWAMMLGGFSMVGCVMRRRKAAITIA